MQKKQTDLFDDFDESELSEPPAQRHSDTSVAAAEQIKESASTLRMRVYQYLQSVPNGSTDEEMQTGIPMPQNTQRPRRGELVATGLVIDSGKRRKTTSGRMATVWEAR